MEDSNTNAAICCSVTSSLIPFLFGNKLFLMLGIFLKIITLCQGSCLLCGQSVGMVVGYVETVSSQSLLTQLKIGGYTVIKAAAISVIYLEVP